MSFPGCVKVKKCNFGNCHQSTQTAFELWQMINRTSIRFYEFKVEMVDVLSGIGSMVDGKVRAALLGRGCQRCPQCNATPKEMMNLALLLLRDLDVGMCNQRLDFWFALCH